MPAGKSILQVEVLHWHIAETGLPHKAITVSYLDAEKKLRLATWYPDSRVVEVLDNGYAISLEKMS